MFKNDRMMLVLTGLILAIFAGSMVQYGDKIMALMSGEKVVATQDDSYSVRAGSSQILDVLSNDTRKGPIVVLSRPRCGTVELTGNNRVSYASDASCEGAVEFAYCVDADGKCDPNAVKINVINVQVAESEPANSPQNTQPDTRIAANTGALPPSDDGEPAPSGVQPSPDANAAPRPAPVTAAQPVQPAPASQSEAPQMATTMAELSPQALAAPSLTELVSPDVAVASIRRPSGGLNSASASDQTIGTQNSASIGQTAAIGPSSFAAPAISESSDIALGSNEIAVTKAPTQPSTLLSAQAEDANIVQLERGPSALAALQVQQSTPATPESPPLVTNSTQQADAPVFVAAAQTTRPALEQSFDAAPVEGGPIALVALNPSSNNGDSSGESLNVALSEPGVQGFNAPHATPLALAPASARSENVTVLARGPSLNETVDAPRPLGWTHQPLPQVMTGAEPEIVRNDAHMGTPVAVPNSVPEMNTDTAAAGPNQINIPDGLALSDSVSRFISISQISTPPTNLTTATAMPAPNGQAVTLPSVNLEPAAAPPVLEASLPAAPEISNTPTVTAPPQNSACAINLTAFPQNGANIALSVSAACKPDEMLTIEHAGIAFSVRADSLGRALVLVPAMQSPARVDVTFEDQSSANTTVEVPDINDIVRAGVSWRAPAALDISAVEFGAALGSEGHVTSESPRDYQTSLLKGGGYLVKLGDPTLMQGALAEVYTLPIARIQQRGTVAMSVSLNDAAAVCGQLIVAKTVRSRDNSNADIRSIRFTVPTCATVSNAPIPLPGAIDDIRVAGR